MVISVLAFIDNLQVAQNEAIHAKPQLRELPRRRVRYRNKEKQAARSQPSLGPQAASKLQWLQSESSSPPIGKRYSVISIQHQTKITQTNHHIVTCSANRRYESY